MKTTLLGVLCFVVLCVIFSLGLWPFHPPRNDVSWLKQSNGIELGRYGTVLSSGELGGSGSDSCSIEIWAQPNRWQNSATILALYRSRNRALFTVRQSLTDLELSIETRHGSRTDFYAGNALGPSLQQKKPVFITATSSQDGTNVYLDGVLVMTAPHFTIPREVLASRLIVGDSPLQPDSFRGQIRGVALYNAELNAVQVLRHYRSWTSGGAPDIVQGENNIALYLFGEKAGRVIHNGVSGGVDLDVPESYFVLDKIALEPFWTEFNFSRGYWGGILKNIVGFVPVGFCFYAWIMAAGSMRRATLLTLVLGFLVSLTIEVLQIFLPTRDSGTTDLVTNTLGTYVGIFCYREIYLTLVTRFPILGWIETKEPKPEANSKHPTHCSS